MSAPGDFSSDPRGADQSPIIFLKSAEWDGVRIRHCRVRRSGALKYCHAEHLIAVPLSGSVRAEPLSVTAKREVVCRTVGHTSIIPSGEPYLTHFEGEVEYLTVYLEPSLLARAAKDHSGAGGVSLAHAADAADPLVRQLALGLMAEAESEGRADRLYLDSLTAALTAHLLKRYASGGGRRPSSGGLSGCKLLRAVGFMEEHLEADITLAEVAGSAGLSPFHFARAFKQTTGLTPHQYLVGLRVERAKALLGRGDITLAEVGYRAGFKNQSHFTTLFRRLTSVTPGQYRRAVRG